MKIFKLFFLFLIITPFWSCTNNFKENTVHSKIEPTSNFGRFLSTRYSLRVGDTEVASKIISKSKNLRSDLTLSKLNFNSYLINGEFDKAKKFALTAPSNLNKLPMYSLPDFVIDLKNDKLLNPNNFIFLKKQLPGFKVVFEKVKYLKFVQTNNLESILLNKKNLNIFSLLIFEDTKIENQIYSKMPKTNLSLIENILFLGYLKRNYPEEFNTKINDFSLRFNYDIEALKLYFKNEKKNYEKPSHKFIFANLFTYLSYFLSSKQNIPNSYLKILNEISYYLEPSIGNSNYFLAEIYSNENNFKIALDKLDRIEESSFMFLYSKIKKYNILKKTNKNKAYELLKFIQKKYPNNNEVIFLTAHYYKKQDKYNKAIKLYDKLIQQNNNNYNYYYQKAICLDKLNKWEDSKKILLDLNLKDPNNAYVLNYLSYSMAIRNEDLTMAKKLITKALEIEKNNGFFLDTLGWIQFKQNDVDKAVQSLQLAVELEPNNSEIIDHLGDVYHKIGRKKEAIFEWNRALIGNADDKLKNDIKLKLKKFAK